MSHELARCGLAPIATPRYCSKPPITAAASWRTDSTLRSSSWAAVSLAYLLLRASRYLASLALISSAGALLSRAFCNASASGLGSPPNR